MAKQPNPYACTTFFIADLHLDPQRQQALALSLQFFEQVRGAQALYILGDLFEYWVGDDAGIELYRDVIRALASISESGCKITVMLGNRDFLLGNNFARAIAARLVLDDELVIDTNTKESIVLLHGDTLCTDDTDYQGLRKQMRNEQWQQQFLSKSIDERIAYADQLRAQSRSLSAGKSASMMDVNAEQVQARMAAHQSKLMIHGHTHRPMVHTNRSQDTQRLVLGDWHDDHAHYVVKDAHGLHLKNFRGRLDIPPPSA